MATFMVLFSLFFVIKRDFIHPYGISKGSVCKKTCVDFSIKFTRAQVML